MKCLVVMGRVSPMVSPHPSNDESSVGKENKCVVEMDLGEFLAEI
jgi:hypothetical protein